MKFFEISDGRCVNLDEIEAVEKIDDLNCRVMTEYNEYEAKMPYSTMISILEAYHESEKEVDNSKVLNEISTKIGSQGFFAG